MLANPRGISIQRAASLMATCCATAGAACLPADSARAATLLGSGDVLDLSFNNQLLGMGGLNVSQFVGIDRSVTAGFDLGVVGARASAKAAAGLQVDAKLTGSATSVQFGGTVSPGLPTYVVAGQEFAMRSRFEPTWGQMATSSPQASMDLELYVEALLKAQVSAFGRSKDFRVGGKKTIWERHLSSPMPEPLSYSNDLFSVEARLPQLDSQGSRYAGGMISEKTAGQFFHASADVDVLLQRLTGWNFGIDACLSIAIARGCFEAKLLDLGLTLDASLVRNLTARPQVSATFLIEDGRKLVGPTDGELKLSLLDGFDYGSTLDIDVKYTAAVDLEVTTSIEADIDLDIELLKGKASLDVLKPSCKLLKLRCKLKMDRVFDKKFGPVWAKEFELWDATWVLDRTHLRFDSGFGEVLASMQIPILPAGADPILHGFVMAAENLGAQNGSAFEVEEPPPVFGMLLGLVLLRRRFLRHSESS